MGFLIQIHLEDSEILIVTCFFSLVFGISNGFKSDVLFVVLRFIKLLFEYLFNFCLVITMSLRKNRRMVQIVWSTHEAAYLAPIHENVCIMGWKYCTLMVKC